MPPKFAVSLLLAAACGWTSSSAAPPLRSPQEIRPAEVRPPAADIAAALQRRYATIKDFTADFTQTYEGGVLRRKESKSGVVYIKKPGMMRWEYEKPQKQLFVSDGRTLYMYFPADKQVMKSRVTGQEEATSAVLFLMGRGDVTRDFSVRYADSSASDVYVLRLDPKQRQQDYDWLQVAVDKDTLQIRALTAGDAQGGRSTFTFSDFKENTGLSDKIFQFSIPRGTEVITSGRTP